MQRTAPRPFSRVLLALAISLASLLGPRAALAQDARAEFLRGQSAYEAADYEEAVRAWTRAYELDPRPLLQVNISQALERLGRLEEAARALEVFLRDAPPDHPNASSARARLTSLEARIAETGVRLVGGPDGAIVRIDGEDAGRLPRPDPFPVAPGSHELAVEHEGRRFTTSVAVPAGQQLEIQVRMPELVAASGGGDDTAWIAGWVLAGAGGAMALSSIATGIVALDTNESLRERCPDMRCPAGEEFEGDRESGQALAITTDVLLFGGLAIAASGVVLALVTGDGSAPENEAAPQVSASCGPTGCAVSARGRF